jgi:hypothetical protein
MDLVERARKYLSRMEPSVSGSNGHNALLSAAGALVNGFDFDDGLAMQLLQEEFNPRCSPPWSERELRHKINQTRKLGGKDKPGYLIGENRERHTAPARPASNRGQEPERIKKRQDFDPEALKRMMIRGFNPSNTWFAERSPIDPTTITPTGFLDAIFGPGEATLVFLNFYSQGQFGHVAGAPGRTFQLGRRPGEPKRQVPAIPATAREGAWFLPSPLDGKWHPTGSVDDHGNPILSRRSGASVTAWRHLLLESDDAPEKDWINLLCQLPLPITALYTSGGRSIHALVKIDTPSKSAFDAFRDRISPLLSRLGADPAAISGVRLTRLPGVLREGTVDKDGKYHRYEKPRLQRLLYLNPQPEILALANLPRLRIIPAAP